MKFLDQMGNAIQLESPPERIISLVPSITELLFDLGLDREIVGVTRHCILPVEKVVGKPRVGDVKDFDFAVINDLHPKLIIGNKEENYKEGILRLQEKHPVWMSDITTLGDALDMIRSVGRLVGHEEQAVRLAEDISNSLDSLDLKPGIKTAYLIWNHPCMAAGGKTFINEMMTRCGLENIFAHKDRYPRIEPTECAPADVILLSSEPYSFSSDEKLAFVRQFPSARVIEADGLMFSWYGSRLRYSADYFKELHRRCLSDLEF